MLVEATSKLYCNTSGNNFGDHILCGGSETLIFLFNNSILLCIAFCCTIPDKSFPEHKHRHYEINLITVAMLHKWDRYNHKNDGCVFLTRWKTKMYFEYKPWLLTEFLSWNVKVKKSIKKWRRKKRASVPFWFFKIFSAKVSSIYDNTGSSPHTRP